jgi:sulfur-oxidizing protein SoxY
MKRRLFLKSGFVGTVAAAVLGMFSPLKALASRPAGAFEAKTVQDALKTGLGSEQVFPSDAITIKAPDLAENGAVVPVEITTRLPNPETISILVNNNQTPLAATFSMAAGANGSVSTRIKMAKSSNVSAVVRSGGKLYIASKEIKVTIGGCGG